MSSMIMVLPMPRKRQIKPQFFANEYLAELSIDARLLFIGLWTIADRSGRLEDRPLKIKGTLFPYDNMDVNALLDSLANSEEKFIVRYTHGDKKYLQISNFEKHQNFHKDEPVSSIPPPSYEHHANTMQAPCNNDTNTTQESCKNALYLVSSISNPVSSNLLKRSSSSDTAAGGAEGSEDLENQAQETTEQETTETPGGKQAESGKSRPPRAYDHANKYYKAASWLKQKVMQNTKKKIREPTEANLQSWADTFRLMESTTADNLPWEEIKETLKWTVSDSFWGAVIQSADSFRKNYARLVMSSERKPPDEDDGPVYRDLGKYKEDD